MACEIYIDQSTTKVKRKTKSKTIFMPLLHWVRKRGTRIAVWVCILCFLFLQCLLITWFGETRRHSRAFWWARSIGNESQWRNAALAALAALATQSHGVVSASAAVVPRAHTHTLDIYLQCNKVCLSNFGRMRSAAPSAFEESCSIDLLVCNCIEGCCLYMRMRVFWFYFFGASLVQRDAVIIAKCCMGGATLGKHRRSSEARNILFNQLLIIHIFHKLKYRRRKCYVVVVYTLP